MRKPAKMILAYSITFIALILIVPISVKSTPGNKVQITSHRNMEKVGHTEVVSGTFVIEDDSEIWILVHPKLLVDQWWPQNKPVVDNKGNWQALVYFGLARDIGKEFEMVVATFGKEEIEKIRKYHDKGRKTGNWAPIAFPKPTSLPQILTLIKTSHD